MNKWRWLRVVCEWWMGHALILLWEALDAYNHPTRLGEWCLRNATALERAHWWPEQVEMWIKTGRSPWDE